MAFHRSVLGSLPSWAASIRSIFFAGSGRLRVSGFKERWFSLFEQLDAQSFAGHAS